MKKEDLVKALDEAGHRESALLLQNWGEMDSIAKSMLSKKVREEDWSSEHTDPSINPALGGKYGKIHGGDPRKEKDTGDMAVENIKDKPRKRISGASNLRFKRDLKNEQGKRVNKDFK